MCLPYQSRPDEPPSISPACGGGGDLSTRTVIHSPLVRVPRMCVHFYLSLVCLIAGRNPSLGLCRSSHLVAGSGHSRTRTRDATHPCFPIQSLTIAACGVTEVPIHTSFRNVSCHGSGVVLIDWCVFPPLQRKFARRSANLELIYVQWWGLNILLPLLFHMMSHKFPPIIAVHSAHFIAKLCAVRNL